MEGDGGYFGVYGHERQPMSPDPGTFAKIDPGAYATARGRIGLAWDRWLFYATGGWIGSDYERRLGAQLKNASKNCQQTAVKESAKAVAEFA